MSGLEFLTVGCAGVFVGLLAAALLYRMAASTTRRLGGHKHPYVPSAPFIPARVTGVYGTAHTPIGDFDTKGPESIIVDCEMMMFEMPLGRVDWSSTIESFTFHFGTKPVTVDVKPSVTVVKGNNVHVMMPISMAGLEAGGQVPDWTRFDA